MLIAVASEDKSGHIGSVSLIDSQISGVQTAIEFEPPSENPLQGSTGLVLDNTKIEGPIVDSSGKKYLEAGSYKNWVLGPVYTNNTRSWTSGQVMEYQRESTLLGTPSGLPVTPYFERKRTQYEDKAPSDFVHIKDLGAKGM